MKVAHCTFLVLCALCAGVACATAVAQDRVFPLEKYEEALKYRFVGKIVLRMQ